MVFYWVWLLIRYPQLTNIPLLFPFSTGFSGIFGLFGFICREKIGVCKQAGVLFEVFWKLGVVWLFGGGLVFVEFLAIHLCLRFYARRFSSTVVDLASWTRTQILISLKKPRRRLLTFHLEMLDLLHRLALLIIYPLQRPFIRVLISLRAEWAYFLHMTLLCNFLNTWNMDDLLLFIWIVWTILPQSRIINSLIFLKTRSLWGFKSMISGAQNVWFI